MPRKRYILAVGALLATFVAPAQAELFHFATNDPDGLMAMASRPSTPGKIEIEAADDFITPGAVQINHATFTGLLTGGATTANISQVVVEVYRIFPLDSDTVRTIHVPTRANSPSDVEFVGRDSAVAGQLTFTTSVLSTNFSAGNSVLNGIHPSPGQTTGGDGTVRGTEVLFDVNFTTPIDLPKDHYFFIPQVAINTADGQFYWLSAPKPIVAPGTPFNPDLQTWIRDANLDPDWLRVGTDIVGTGAFNAAFTLDGVVAPEPTSLALAVSGLGLAFLARRKLYRPGL